jgi:hypothetical protein
MKKKPRGKKKSAVEHSKTVLPPNTYEEWIRRQIVRPAKKKVEVQVPVDSYENWIRKQVAGRFVRKLRT